MDTETPAPLQRLGTYRIDERPWTNAAPGRAATAEELGRLWLKLLRYHAEQLEIRNRGCDCGCEQPSHIQWRYGQKIAIKVHESVIELLHRIIAPDAPFLCAHECPHLAAGATPDQLRRFLNAIDAKAARCREEARGGHGTYEEDQREEAAIMRDCRHYLAEAMGIEIPYATPPAG